MKTIIHSEKNQSRLQNMEGCSQAGKISIVKTVTSSKAIYSFKVIHIKIPMMFITEIKKLTLQFMLKHKRPQIVKAILSKNTYHNT
jgi:hypothetical protein